MFKYTICFIAVFCVDIGLSYLCAFILGSMALELLRQNFILSPLEGILNSVYDISHRL